MRTNYREEPCKSALNRVKGMGFHWSLNPHMGCAHQCTFCYVRAFERRAERPSDDRYGSSIRVRSKADVSVNFSVPTLDEHIWRYTEPHTSPPIQRLRALRRLVDAGIRAGVGVAPILPGLSDDPQLLADVVRAARDHGATHVWPNMLYLRRGTREHFLDKLASIWPELVPMYEQLYAGRAYLPDAETRPLRATVQKLATQAEVADRRLVRPAVPTQSEPLDGKPQAPAVQLALVLSDDARSRATTRPVDGGPVSKAA